MESVKISPDWDKAAPPLEARAVKPIKSDRDMPFGRGVFPKPEGPMESQVPFRTPQANRYATNSGAKPHKLHVTLAGPEVVLLDEEPVVEDNAS